MAERELQYDEKVLELDQLSLDDLKPVLIALFGFLKLKVIKQRAYDWYEAKYEVTDEELVERDD